MLSSLFETENNWKKKQNARKILCFFPPKNFRPNISGFGRKLIYTKTIYHKMTNITPYYFISHVLNIVYVSLEGYNYNYVFSVFFSFHLENTTNFLSFFQLETRNKRGIFFPFHLFSLLFFNYHIYSC